MDQRALEYHKRQYKEVYRSTIFFCDYIEALGLIVPQSNLRVLDACCGAGANTLYMARRYPKCTFVGVERNGTLIKTAYEQTNDVEPLMIFWEADAFELPSSLRGQFDGIVCLQTLSWLEGFSKALSALCELKPKWLAFSSLFYDGPVSCDITIHEYAEPGQLCRNQFYNIYSLPEISDFLKYKGYRKVTYKPFKIDIDLPKPDHKLMETYTRTLLGGERLQQSGPLMMPWYFVVAEKDET